MKSKTRNTLPQLPTRWRTGLFDIDLDSPLIEESPFLGRGWHADILVHTNIGTREQNEKWRKKITAAYGIIGFSGGGKRLAGGKEIIQAFPEIIIVSDKHHLAFSAANFMPCAMTLLDGALMDVGQGSSENIWDLDNPPIQSLDGKILSFGALNGILSAAKITAKASHKQVWKNSIIRYWLSHKLCSISWEFVVPRMGTISYPVRKDPVYHGLFVQSIVAAYGAIEELELQIKPARVNKKYEYKNIAGNYHPQVIQSLEKRCEKYRISPHIKMIWLKRGPNRRVDKKQTATTAFKAQYAQGKVRDEWVSIVDALYMAARLRSNISAHKFTNDTKSLTPIDVYNVQNLARGLIFFIYGNARIRRTHA